VSAGGIKCWGVACGDANTARIAIGLGAAVIELPCNLLLQRDLHEVELALVDAREMDLRGAIGDVLAGLPAAASDRAKSEFLQCYVEIDTGVCRDVAEAGRDLVPAELLDRPPARQGAEDGPDEDR